MNQQPNTADFEDYNRIKILGEGAFGKAYLVESLLDKTKWVMKQVDISAQTPKEKEDTVKEAKILQALNHPNIVKFKEVYLTKKGRLCMIMEYADGGDLAQKIKDQKNQLFAENQILDWFTQISLALKHVHDRKILHRDLKGQNIFLTKDNRVKLGDFGIARVLGNTLDKAKTQVGTPYYLSPEIIESKPYSYASDLWSLGAVLYEMCTLKPPFVADSLHFLALKIIRGQFTQIHSSYSKDLKNLVASLLQTAPQKRPNIQQVLKTPIVVKRIKEFLTESVKQVEFAHTILHKQKLIFNLALNDIKVVSNELPCPPNLFLQKQINSEPAKIQEKQAPPAQQPKQASTPQNGQYQFAQKQPPQQQQQQQSKPQVQPVQMQQQQVQKVIAAQPQSAQVKKSIQQPIVQQSKQQVVQQSKAAFVAKPQTSSKVQRSNSKNKICDNEHRAKQDQERQKFQAIKQEADQKRKEDEKKKQIEKLKEEDLKQKQKEESIQKRDKLRREMAEDLRQKRKQKAQETTNQGKSNEDLGSAQQVEQQKRNKTDSDLDEYNSISSDEIVANDIENDNEGKMGDLQIAGNEQDCEIDYGIQCDQEVDKDMLENAEMVLQLEDIVNNMNEKVSQLDQFENSRQYILDSEILEDIRSDHFDDNDFDLSLTNNKPILDTDNFNYSYFAKPEAIQSLKLVLDQILTAQNCDKAINILRKELYIKDIDEIDRIHGPNSYQNLLPFLSLQELKKYLPALFQYIILSDK